MAAGALPWNQKKPMNNPPRNAQHMLLLAKMSAVAIPLKFVLQAEHADRLKYCVITNWWKERDKHGDYLFPKLDFSLYS